MNSFFVFGIVLLATANNIAADVSIGSVVNNSSHPVFELLDFACHTISESTGFLMRSCTSIRFGDCKNLDGVFKSLEGHLQPAEIEQLKNLIQGNKSQRRVMFEVLTTQVTWSVEEMEQFDEDDFSALTATETNIVNALENETEIYVKPFQLRLKPGADAEKIGVLLNGLEGKVGDGSYNLKAYTYFYQFIFEYVTKQPGSEWVVNSKTFDEFC